MTLETLAKASPETMVTRAADVFVGPIGFCGVRGSELD